MTPRPRGGGTFTRSPAHSGGMPRNGERANYQAPGSQCDRRAWPWDACAKALRVSTTQKPTAAQIAGNVGPTPQTTRQTGKDGNIGRRTLRCIFWPRFATPDLVSQK